MLVLHGLSEPPLFIDSGKPGGGLPAIASKPPRDSFQHPSPCGLCPLRMGNTRILRAAAAAVGNRDVLVDESCQSPSRGGAGTIAGRLEWICLRPLMLVTRSLAASRAGNDLRHRGGSSWRAPTTPTAASFVGTRAEEYRLGSDACQPRSTGPTTRLGGVPETSRLSPAHRLDRTRVGR